METCVHHHLSADQASLGYGQKVIVDSLSLEVPRQKLTSIIGPNGCGKSTLLRGLARILTPMSGAVLLDDASINSHSTRWVSKVLSFLPQAPQAPGALTVEELVSFGRYPYRSVLGGLNHADRDIITQALEATHTADIRNRPIGSLSGGQKQRVWIAMTLAQQTDYLILDEPTTFLDWLHQIELLDLLEELKVQQGKTILLVMHDLNLAARYSDYMIAMVDGRIVAKGDTDEVMNPECLRKVFGFEATILTDPKTSRPVCLAHKH